MTKKLKKFLATLLAMSMLASLMIPGAFAEEEKSSVSLHWELSTSTLQQSDEDQTVTLKLTATPHAVAPLVDNCGDIGFTVSIPEGFEVVSVESSQITYSQSGNSYSCFRMNNEDGNGHNYSVTDVGTITVKVPANTPAGEYSIGVTDVYYTLWNNDTGAYGRYTWDNIGSTVTVEATEPQPVAVESVSLDKTTVTLEIGGTETLTATVLPENADDKTVTWTTSDAAIATVENGVVTAVAAGEATITATAGEKSATCTVTVKAAEEPPEEPKNTCTFSWNVSPATVDISSGEQTVTVTLTGEYFRHGVKADMAADSLLKVWLSVFAPEGFTIAKVENKAGNVEFTNNGSGAYERPNASEIHTNEVVTITLTVPQSTENGSYELVLKDLRADVMFNTQKGSAGTPWVGYTLGEVKIPINVTGKPEEPEKNYVAETGGVQYETLQEAIDNAGDGATVTLIAETVTESVVVGEGKNIVLDLNGKTLTGTMEEKKAHKDANDDNIYYAMKNVITNQGILTIVDSSTGGTILGGTDNNTSYIGWYKDGQPQNTYPGRSGIALVNENGATCTIEGGTIKRGDNGTYGNYTVQNMGTMEIKGGLITNNSNTSSLLINYNYGPTSDGRCGSLSGVSMTIRGGEVRQENCIALKNDPNTELTIAGGTISFSSNTKSTLLYGTVKMISGTVNADNGFVEVLSYKEPTGKEFKGSFEITGGTLTCKAIRVGHYNSTSPEVNPELKISGKNTRVNATETENQIAQHFYGTGAATPDAVKIEISGGTFNWNVWQGQIVPGYVAGNNNNGTWTIRERIHSTITTDIGKKSFMVGTPVEFTYTTKANDDAGTMVIGTSVFSDPDAIEKLEYYEVQDGNWYELTGDFGPSIGFTMSDATSKFRVTFKKAGEYTVNASMKTVPGGVVLCSTGEVKIKVETPVAEVNGVQYTSLQAALDAVKAQYNIAADTQTEWTVKLVNDTTECVNITLTPSLKNNKTAKVTIDLNGKTITGSGEKAVISVAKGGSMNAAVEFIIDDSSAEKTGTITGGNASQGGAIYVSGGNSNTKLTINGGKYTGNTATNGGAIASFQQKDVPVIINGGTFTGNTATGKGGAIYARSLTVNGGTFTGNTADMGGALYVVGTGWTANLDVAGGKISGNTAATYGDDIVFGLAGKKNYETTLKLMDASAMDIEGVEAWLVDGYNLTESCDRVSETSEAEWVAFTADQWPNTKKDGPAIIALKAGGAPVELLGTVTAYGGGTVNSTDPKNITVIFDGKNSLTFAADGNDFGREPNKWWAGIHVTAPEGIDPNAAKYQKIGKWWEDDGTKTDWTDTAAVQADGQYWAMVTPEFMGLYKGSDNQLMYRYGFDWNGSGKINQYVTIIVKDDVQYNMDGVVAAICDATGKLLSGYGSLEEAIEAAKDGQTVKLMQSVTLNTTMGNPGYTSAVLITKNITLDGNGNTITVSGNLHGIQVYGATVEIKNVTVTGAGKDALLVNGGANVTAENFNTNENAWGAINVDHASKLNFKSGTLAEDSKIWADDEASEITAPEGWNWVKLTNAENKTQKFYSPAFSLSLSPATLNMTVGYTVSAPVTLTATVNPEAATVVWSVEGTAVTVGETTGVVTPVAVGTATITATVGSMTATCTVTVTNTTAPYVPPTPSTPDTGDEDLEDPDTPLADRPWLFVDVHEGDYFYDAVKRLFDKNVVGGTTDTTYEPYTDATRGMVAQILYGMAGSPDVTGLEMPFSDVSESDFYYKAVLWGYANKVLGGYPEDNTFRGENTITREELAALLHQYGVEKLGLADTKGDLSGFIDAAEISDWAVEHMKWAVGMEIMHGDDAKKLMPVDNTIRADMTIMLNNLDMKVSDEK